MERKTCLTQDGVRIAYSVSGVGRTALVFVHGGMADRSFFDGQLAAFADRYRVIALDLAGHGESGVNRARWTMGRFGTDIEAVADAERLTRIILFGNSLGGPAAVEAALLLGDRVLGVVGIDTFQDLGRVETAESRQEQSAAVRQRADALRADFSGSMKAMVKQLFHPDADPELVAGVERRMLRARPDVVQGMLGEFAAYDYKVSIRKLAAPLRAINGDLYPTDIEAIRRIRPDFDAVVIPHTGHYPMIERPAEFNRHVQRLAMELDKQRPPR